MMDQGVLDCVTGAVMADLNVIFFSISSACPVLLRKRCVWIATREKERKEKKDEQDAT